MSLCTICSLDPCPHLKVSGGTAGAPIGAAVGIGIKYAPSTRPTCPSCDRVHRNIGTDNQPVCAWRTYSRAKGSDFEAFTPDAVDEFARWYRSGGWSAPARKARAPKIAKAPGTVIVPTMSATPDEIADDPGTTITPTVPTIDDLEEPDDEELVAVARLIGTADGTPEEQEADILQFEVTPDPAPRSTPAFAIADPDAVSPVS